MKPLSAAIIGLGNIGLNYDYHIQDDSEILTHASALHYHSGFDLIASVDKDEAQCERFEKKYNHPAFQTIDEMYQYCQPDVLVVAVPTFEHFSIIQSILTREPKIIIAEKPFTKSVKEAELLLQITKSTILVNYIRRFEPGVIRLKKLLHAGEIGNIVSVDGLYWNDIYKSGSHLIDLIQFLFGEVDEIAYLQSAFPEKPSFAGRIRDIEINCQASENLIEKFELTITGRNGSALYRNLGQVIEIQYDNGAEVSIEQDFDHYQWYVYEHLYQHINERIPLVSTPQTALPTLSLIRMLKPY